VIRAGAAVFATNSPTNNKVAIHSKQIPDRTYVIAGRVPKGKVPDALVWDTYDSYHYVRIQEWSDDEDLLIVGGEDHRSGEATDMDQRFARLTDWTRKRYPGFGKADYSWSGQVLEPADFMPFSGRNPGNENIYIHTGDSGQGITNGVAGSLTIVPLILGEDSRYAALFDPGRKPAAMESLGEFVRGQIGAAKNLAEHLGPGELDSVDDLKPGEGGIIRRGLHKVAAYRGPGRHADRTLGELHAPRLPGALERLRTLLGLSVPRFAIRARRQRAQRPGGSAPRGGGRLGSSTSPFLSRNSTRSSWVKPFSQTTTPNVPRMAGMPIESSTHSSDCGSIVKTSPTATAAAAAQTRGQRQPWTGAPSRWASRRALSTEARPSASISAAAALAA
jgi:hypothetical protein